MKDPNSERLPKDALPMPTFRRIVGLLLVVIRRAAIWSVMYSAVGPCQDRPMPGGRYVTAPGRPLVRKAASSENRNSFAEFSNRSETIGFLFSHDIAFPTSVSDLLLSHRHCPVKNLCIFQYASTSRAKYHCIDVTGTITVRKSTSSRPITR
jgi:hypothetical protein